MRFYDVSGLKHHRKQWMGYFTDVHAILFVVSLSCYDQMMSEDRNTNRMEDAIKVRYYDGSSKELTIFKYFQ